MKTNATPGPMTCSASLDINGWHGGTLYFDGHPVAGVYASRGKWVAYYDDAQPEGARTFARMADAMHAAEGWVTERLSKATGGAS